MDFILTVPEDQIEVVRKFLNELNLSLKPASQQVDKIIKEPRLNVKQQKLVDELKHSLHQVELHQQGKIQLRSAYELLDEL